MAITRRVFLKGGALAIVGTSAIPGFLTRAVYAADTAEAGTGKKRLIVLFQRGAADGLNIVVPHGESAYYSMRPSIAIPRPHGTDGALDLNGFFGLHPSMTASSLCGILVTWQSSTLRGRPTTRAHTSMRKTIWSRAHRASRLQKMVG